MKILFLTQTYPRFESDTAGPFIRAIARALAAAGDEIHVLAPWHPRIDAANVSSRGIRFHTYKYAPLDRLCLLGYSQTMQADVRLKGVAYLLGPSMILAARRKLGKLLDAHRFDCLNAHWLVPNGIIAASPARRAKVPLVVSLHGSGIFMAERNKVFYRLASRAAAHFDGVTSCSPDFLQRTVLSGLKPGAIRETIPYGVNVEKFEPRREDGKKVRDELGLPQDAPILFAVGRMVYKKGFAFLLEAARSLQRNGTRFTLVLGGDGDLFEDLKGRATSWGLSGSTVFPGLIYREALPKYYQAADVFVMPSVTDSRGNVDGLPNVVLEAMASGLPVVASNISGIPLAVKDGVNGRLVPPADPEALARALKELLDSEALRAAWGRASRSLAEEKLTWAHIGRRYRAVYERAVSAYRASSSRIPSA